MKILLDTNIIIHREASTVINEDIGVLFNWIDKLKYQKYVHPASIEEIRKHGNHKVVSTMEIKIKNYNLLRTESPESNEITEIRRIFDQNENDYYDTTILKEIFNNRVDFFISEDRKIHQKANHLGIPEKVFTIESFLEKVTTENPDLTDYQVLSIQKEYFGNIDINDSFFNSLKEDYPGFENWFNRKAEEMAYICKSKEEQILAFLYIKIEDKTEDYSNISPQFQKKKRLKIGTFKVVLNGFKLGERFLKIIFDNARLNFVDEIYVTIFKKRTGQHLLIKLLEDWGFCYHGTKSGGSEDEFVYLRDFSPKFNLEDPKKTYPYISKSCNIFIVPIYPAYHTELFPDSILNNESPDHFIENEPHRNAIQKVYISRSINRSLNKGDLIVFYRTKFNGPAYFTSVVTTIGVVDSVITNINDENHFVSLCRKRSVFSDAELKEHWNHNSRSRPFIVNFYYVYSFPMPRINLKRLLDFHIIAKAPRGFEPITKQGFETLIIQSKTNGSFIID